MRSIQFSSPPLVTQEVIQALTSQSPWMNMTPIQIQFPTWFEYIKATKWIEVWTNVHLVYFSFSSQYDWYANFTKEIIY